MIRKTNRPLGFTIVELLIVIVVIGILAAISIVAYSGIQVRASYAKEQQEMQSIHQAIILFKTDTGAYPDTDNQWFGWDQAIGDSFIPGLSPKYIAKIPQLDTALAYLDSYLYLSNGTDYQLIRYRNLGIGGLPQIQRNNPRSWFGGADEAWGYWNAGSSTVRASD